MLLFQGEKTCKKKLTHDNKTSKIRTWIKLTTFVKKRKQVIHDNKTSKIGSPTDSMAMKA
jgi:hypothetical protein